MKIKFYLSLLIITCAVLLISFVREDEAIKKLLTSFQKFTDSHVQEKVYIHTDKPYYAIGDEIWFKAYVVDAQNMGPTPQSNYLYVELINSRDSVKKTLKLPLVAGLGWGNFALKDSLKEGNYRLRAYTQWMRNFGEDFFYDKIIKVGDAWTNQLITKTDYSFEKIGNTEAVTATINFSNIDGNPYASKEVTYNVELDFRAIAKGKGITDSEGNLVVKFINDKPFLAKSGRLTTSLKIAESTIVTKYIPIKNTSNDTDIQFFPEGGDLVTGIRCKVAFKALNSDGLGEEVSGYLEDSDGVKIANFKTQHFGMGVFSFTPVAGKTYQAVISFKDGSEKNFKLSAIKQEGVILSVNTNLGDSVIVKIVANQAFAERNTEKIYTVIAQNSGNIVYTAKSKLIGLNFAAKLPKVRFTDGITQFTLFDENMLPIAERLIFTMPRNILNLEITPNQNEYLQRSKTILSIKATDPSGKPVFGSYSLSVTDETKVPESEDEEKTIFNHLLLTSDIKGYIENPNYYFNNTNAKKLADLDILMMTQGWRRFNWKNIFYETFQSLSFKPEKTTFLRGRLTAGKDKPVVNGTVSLLSSGPTSLLIQAKTDAKGEFLIDSLFYPDSTRFVVQGRNAKGGKNVDIELYTSPLQIVTKNKNSADLTTNINQSMLAYLKNSKTQYEEWLRNGIVNRSILLKEVKVVDTKPKVENSANLNGAGNADRILTEKDFEFANTMDQVLQGRVAGLQIIGGIAYIRNEIAQIIIDGIFVDGEFLNSINPRDVESIEILKSINYTAIYGVRGSGGVIIINTKRGKPGYSVNSYAPGIITYSPLGLFSAKEFYVPNYDDPKLNEKVADLRTTIFWKPNVFTDSTGTSIIEFVNADGVGIYKVVLEGMDLNGHIGRQVIRYQVKPKN
jgi:TonB-dependent SusC/RagA subfamily outer membrane receptor